MKMMAFILRVYVKKAYKNLGENTIFCYIDSPVSENISHEIRQAMQDHALFSIFFASFQRISISSSVASCR